MSMAEDRARYVKTGLAADYHTWDRDVFLDRMTKLLAKLRADKDAVPALQLGLTEDGVVTVWHYLLRRGDGVVAQSHEECPPEECFDISHPCPPFCG